MSTPRLDLQSAPAAYAAMSGLERTINDLGLDEGLRGLVKLRTSQVNGCAYCVDLHARELREHGEPEHRVWAVSAWRESPNFDERERAALDLAEEMANLPEGRGVSDASYDEAARVFDADELTALLWTATAINAWNRMAVATRATPRGGPPRQAATATNSA